MILTDLFHGHIRWMMRGVAHCDSSSRAPDARAKLREAAEQSGASRVLCMNVAFAHHVIGATDFELLARAGDIELLAARTPADGILIERTGDAVFFANADCPMGVLFDRVHQRAVVMHLGFGSLWKPSQAPPYLLERAVRILAPDGDLSALAFFGGGGIGPCCYGVQKQSSADLARESYLDTLLPERDTWRSVYGPRANQPCIDLGRVIRAQLEQLGVEDISYRAHCTSCSGMPDPNASGFGMYYSNVRDSARKLERNLTLVTLAGNAKAATAL